MSEQLKIFKEGYVDRLLADVKAGTAIDAYRDNKQLEIDPAVVLSSQIMLADRIPTLGTQPADDLESAIAIYEYLGPLTATQASDKRLWTYLAHVTFREYTLNRWTVDESDDVKARDSIIQHWFVSENDRRLRRHAIARLWWAAHLTFAPWENDPVNFVSLKCDDKYVYTRELLKTQDIFQQILERSMGRSKRILVAFLETLRQNPSLSESRKAVRDVIKEANLMLGYRKLSFLPYPTVFNVIEDLASDAVT